MAADIEQFESRLRDVERETSGLSRAYEHLATKADVERAKWQILAGTLVIAGLVVTAIKYLP